MAEKYSQWMTFEEASDESYRGPGIYQFGLVDYTKQDYPNYPVYLGKSKVCVISKIEQHQKGEIKNYVQTELIDKQKDNHEKVLVRYKPTTRQDILGEIAKELKGLKYYNVPQYNRVDENFIHTLEIAQDYSDWMTLEEACRQIYRGPGTYQLRLSNDVKPLYIGKSKVSVISKIIQLSRGEINNCLQKELIEKERDRILVRCKATKRKNIPGEMAKQLQDYKTEYGGVPLYNQCSL